MRLQNNFKILIIAACFFSDKIYCSHSLKTQEGFNKMVHSCVKHLRNNSCITEDASKSSHKKNVREKSGVWPFTLLPVNLQKLLKIYKKPSLKNSGVNSCGDKTLQACLDAIVIAKNAKLTIEPHKLKKSVRLKKGTELLALTESPAKIFLKSKEKEFYKTRLSIYFIILLNEIWDDLKKDSQTLLSIDVAVKKSPNKILQGDYEKWRKFFNDDKKDESMKFFAQRSVDFLVQ